MDEKSEYDHKVERCRQLETYFNNLGIDGRIDLVLRCMMPEWKNAKISEYEKEVFEYHYEGEIYPVLDSVRFKGETPFEETQDIMMEENLIYKNGANELEPTAKAHRLFEYGGWLANIVQIKKDRQRERDNIEAAILTNESVRLTNKIQWVAAGLTVVIIGVSAYTDKQALTISRKDHYLQHIMLQEQQSQKEKFEPIHLHRHNHDSLIKKADTVVLKKP